MDIAIRGKGPDIGDMLPSRIEAWMLAAVANCFAWARDATDTVSCEAPRVRVERSVDPVRGVPVRSQATTDERRMAFGACLEQIHRYKRRVSNRNARREPAAGSTRP